MVTKELTETAAEINVIFDNLSIEILNKIPINVKEFFENIASNTYCFEYDKTKTLNQQELKPKTKGIIALLYRDYICDEAEKQEYIQEYNMYISKKEEEKRQLYNPNNIFKESKDNTTNSAILPVVCKKEKWYTKILKLFRSIVFKK